MVKRATTTSLASGLGVVLDLAGGESVLGYGLAFAHFVLVGSLSGAAASAEGAGRLPEGVNGLRSDL